MAYVPERGDLVWITMNPQAGREQRGRRPALVLSPKTYNRKVGLALMCPVASQVKGYPFEVKVPDDLAVAGVTLADHVRSVDWKARRAERICSPSSVVTVEVFQKLVMLLRP